jgi:hypothetical protein
VKVEVGIGVDVGANDPVELQLKSMRVMAIENTIPFREVMLLIKRRNSFKNLLFCAK